MSVPRSRRARKVGDAYRNLATLLLSTGLAFAALNLLAWPAVELLETDPVTARYGRETVLAAYPERDPDEIAELLDETWGPRRVYEPFLESAERPREGRYVNVSEHGFRTNGGDQPWPPDPERLNVFVFGGSTVFGHGVADDETVPAALERELDAALEQPVSVYNFGAAAYYSTHERILFGQLLADGYRPGLALFVDGLNDLYRAEPEWSARLRRLVSDRPLPLLARVVRQLPLLRLVELIAQREGQRPAGEPPFDPRYARSELLDARIDRYLANVEQSRVLGEGYGVRTLFVVQPVPVHGHDLDRLPFARWELGANASVHFGYPRLRERLERQPPRADVVWAADLEPRGDEPFYVDQAHYSPVGAARLAERIAEEVVQRVEWRERGVPDERGGSSER